MSDLLTLDWDGKHYELNIQRVTSRQWDEVESHTNLTAGEVITALADMTAKSISGRLGRALLWLFQIGSDPNAQFDDDLPLFEFIAAFTQAAKPTDEAGVTEDDETPKAENTLPPSLPISASGSTTVS